MSAELDPKMLSEALRPLSLLIAEQVIEAASPALLERIIAQAANFAPNPLLNVEQAAKRLALSPSTIRTLVHSGAIHRAPDIAEIRIRQSEVDAYGTRKIK